MKSVLDGDQQPKVSHKAAIYDLDFIFPAYFLSGRTPNLGVPIRDSLSMTLIDDSTGESFEVANFLKDAHLRIFSLFESEREFKRDTQKQTF